MRGEGFEQSRKILIRSTNWLGDAVMTVPAMGAVRAAFPHAEIVVVATPAVAELFAGHPACDRVMIWDKKHANRGLVGLLRFSLNLRKAGFDLAILFQNAIEAAIMTWLARIPNRIGYRTDGRAMLLSHGIPISQRERRLHHTDYYLHMINRAGIRNAPGQVSLYCTQGEIEWARQKLADRAWIAINPGAAYGSAKRWLPQRFAATANTMYQELGAHLLLLGGPEDIAIGRQISEMMHTPHMNLIGKTSIRQLMALLSQCRLLLTNDSGPMHIAAALGTPVVAVFGPTDQTATSPVGTFSRVVRRETDCAPCLKRHCPTDHRCMTAIGVEDVMEAVRSLLDRNR
ncbi:MAG: lipopolysaccharide heptosyltransferase II [Desulforhabdus sp.]|jgi:heptosyltransferase-2|nr:lipopolysaccharide heptosyltransferase II [Desulforhabdus sp.]